MILLILLWIFNRHFFLHKSNNVTTAYHYFSRNLLYEDPRKEKISIKIWGKLVGQEEGLGRGQGKIPESMEWYHTIIIKKFKMENNIFIKF